MFRTILYHLTSKSSVLKPKFSFITKTFFNKLPIRHISDTHPGEVGCSAVFSDLDPVVGRKKMLLELFCYAAQAGTKYQLKEFLTKTKLIKNCDKLNKDSSRDLHNKQLS